MEEKLGEPGYLNKNCWLVRNLKFAPYKRCQYCELKFRNCLFLQYQVISLILIVFIFCLSFLIERKISEFLIVSVFTLIIIYGYFFNKSTDKIIRTYFEKRKAEIEALREKIKREETERLAEEAQAMAIRALALKRQAEEIAKMERRLSEAKTEFLAIASHQLRTPLTIIKTYLHMVLSGDYGEITPGAKMAVERSFITNERLIKLVNDFLAATRLETGRVEMKFEKAKIENVIKSVVEQLEPKAKEKNLNLRFEEPKEVLPEILIDKEKMAQVFLNLIDNAIKYTSEGEVLVKVEKIKNKIRSCVQDTGPGLTEKEKEKLFERFSRGEEGRKRWSDGAGLGLFIAKKIVEAHGGRIWAESEGKGKGSKFFVELPIK